MRTAAKRTGITGGTFFSDGSGLAKGSALLLCALLFHAAASAAASDSSIPPCTGGTLTLANGSLDLGWTGITHQSSIYTGPSIGFQVLQRCTDNEAVCNTDDDCDSGQCQPTCDCNDDSDCEITGPTQQSRCATTLTACSSNDDCAQDVPCIHTFGPPLPLSIGGVPTCNIIYFEAPFVGTADTSTGALSAQMTLRWRAHLGEVSDRPCPRCGAPIDDPKVGQQYTCEGGQTTDAVCTVEGVIAEFGGVSHDCAPTLGMNIMGPGTTVRLSDLTTGTSTRTAQLPCKNFSFTSNPLSGTGKCLDDSSACSSNADCRRCSGDPTTPCTGDGECSGKGTCAEAPDQPVSCGYWCHCGFCGDNPGLPCFETADCPQGLTCQMGTGTGLESNAPQQKPNDCTGDGFMCGTQETEKCSQTLVGRCSLQHSRVCADDSDCTSNYGTCEFESRSCFEPRITRTGVPSPLDQHCTTTLAQCSSNDDCGNGVCASDTEAPEAVALMCMPQTSSSAINSMYGIAGPAAIRLGGLLKICRDGDACHPVIPVPICGNGIPEAGEQCDDGDTVFVAGDYCDGLCKRVPCGNPTNSAGQTPTASDALFALRAAVGQISCDLRVCDVDGSNGITATDALLILKNAVGLAVVLGCAAE